MVAVLLTRRDLHKVPERTGDPTAAPDPTEFREGVGDALMHGAAYPALVKLNKTDRKALLGLEFVGPDSNIGNGLKRKDLECLFGPRVASLR